MDALRKRIESKRRELAQAEASYAMLVEQLKKLGLVNVTPEALRAERESCEQKLAALMTKKQALERKISEYLVGEGL